MADYRGPYFRTGIDGSGNYWEIEESTDVPTLQSKAVSRTPSKWTLQKPRPKPAYASLEESKDLNEVPLTSLQVPSNHIPESSDTELEPQTFEIMQLEEPSPKKDSFIISKEYFKQMLMEIWKESPDIIPSSPTSTKAPEVKHANQRVGETINLKESEESIQARKPSLQTPNPNHSKHHRLSARDEKCRMFDCFQKLSNDPPKTPPPQQLQCEASKTSINSEVRRKKKRSKSKKSKTIMTIDSSPKLLSNYDPFFLKYPGILTSFGSPLLQETKNGTSSKLSEKVPMRSSPKRSIAKNEDHDMNSMFTLKKIPLVNNNNGWFNDEIHPSTNRTLSPVPSKKKVSKKRFDAFAPLGMSRALTPSSQPQPQEYFGNIPERTQPLPTMKIKKSQPQSTPIQIPTTAKPKSKKSIQSLKKSIPQPLLSQNPKIVEMRKLNSFLNGLKMTSK